jgi:4-hydroxybenzoate polyprenyltransferase
MPVTVASPSSSRLLAYLQLLRLSNVFTAIADVAMGFLFTHEALSPGVEFACLVVASSALYTAGIVLNDVYDFEHDRYERPERPLPSRRISQTSAARLGWTLLVLGMAAGCFVAGLSGDWRPAATALALAALVVLYDRALKHTPVGPAAMGGCRFLNVLLGMSTSPHRWGLANWNVAAGIGIYIAGVTLFARSEATVSKRGTLVGGSITMLAGMIALWRFPKWLHPDQLTAVLQFQPWNWKLLWLLLTVVIGWRCLWAIRRPESARVRAAVTSAILLVVVLDAVVVFAVRGPEAMAGILLLLLPAIGLGWWVYST